MYILIATSLFSLAAANLIAKPNPEIVRSTPFQAQYTRGTISVVSNRRDPNTPIELVINFEPIRPTEFPFTNAPRTIRINLTGPNAGLGTYTRAAYTENGNTVPAATIEICSDRIPDAQYRQLNTNGRQVYHILGSGLAQVRSVGTSNCYYDISDLPIIRTYSGNGNNVESSQFQTELTRLNRRD